MKDVQPDKLTALLGLIRSLDGMTTYMRGAGRGQKILHSSCEQLEEQGQLERLEEAPGVYVTWGVRASSR